MNKKNLPTLILLVSLLINNSISIALTPNPPIEATSNNFPPTPLGAENITIQNAQVSQTLSPSSSPNSTPTNAIPLKPVELQNNIPKVVEAPNNQRKQAANEKFLEQARIAKNIKERNLKLEEEAKLHDTKRRRTQSDFIDRLLNINYKNQLPPKKLYEREYSQTNLHLPPVYFKSYYLYLAFNAAAKDNLTALNAVLSKYNFLNGQNHNGDTILMHAIQHNSLNSARLLLAKGAYVDAVNQRKRTALHYAAVLGNVELIKLLLSMGSDYTLIDDNDMTAMDYAYSSNHIDAAKIIAEYMEQNKKQ